MFQPHIDPVDAGIAVRRRREAEHHACQRPGPGVEVDAAHERGDIVGTREHLDPVDSDRFGQGGDDQAGRIRDPVVVVLLAVHSEGVGHVAHVAGFADRDPVPEAVLDRR